MPRNPDRAKLCHYTFSDGRRCTLPAHPQHHGLCLNHALRASLAREEDLSAELASPAGDFITQIDINHVIGKLFEALAANRISVRRATALAYLASLLLQSQDGAFEEARRWNLELPTFIKVRQLKSRKDDPNYPQFGL